MLTTAQTETHWLDIIPAIPLARGVPVRLGNKGRTVVVAHIFDDGSFIVGHDHGSRHCRWDLPARVDLDDPQGFAYALRHLWFADWPSAHRFLNHSKDAEGVNAATRMWLDQTTDSDRLALAKALAEVTR